MTPQEELFKKLFNGEVKITAGMDALTRKAYREEMCDIAFRARVSISAVDHVDEEEKRAKKKASGPQGFERSVNIDETSTAAINAIKERHGRQTKAEKTLASLIKSGISEEDAAKLMQAGTILARIKNKSVAELKAVEPTPTYDPNKVITFNPFDKKKE